MQCCMKYPVILDYVNNDTGLYLLSQEMSIFDILEVLHKPLNKFY